MSQVKIGQFKFGEDAFTLRYVLDGEQPVKFVAKDVASSLKYGNCNDAVSKHVDKKYKYTYGEQGSRFATPTSNSVIKRGDPLYLQAHTVLVTKEGVIQLIMKSKLPYAVELQAWLLEEVIPQVLCTGKYDPAIKHQQEETKRMVDRLIKVFTDHTTTLQAALVKKEKFVEFVVESNNKQIEAKNKLIEAKDQHVTRVMTDLNRMYSSFQDTMQRKDDIMKRKDEIIQKKDEQFQETMQKKDEQFKETMQKKDEQFKETIQKKDEQFQETIQRKDEQIARLIDAAMDLSSRAVQYPADERKHPVLCVARDGTTFHGIAGQRRYVQSQKRKLGVKDDDLVLETRRPNPALDWTNATHTTSGAVKRSKRSITFDSPEDAQLFEDTIKYLLSVDSVRK
uniref:BRO-I n=1 Tax=Lymantria dispar multicapsid nuclear polyhedrosis virus TaxID=10449 RepID=A0A7S8IX84_NPVLD|nr:BRO-I [Lymantria dispar multiple nucleopolyhedrovirus]QPD02084.1 BRO-I [Lymantria dispar multiple nucleopolyhedrovirus]